MLNLPRFLTWKNSAEAFAIKCGQIVCFAGGVLVLALAGRKLGTLDLTAGETLYGVLLASAVSLLIIMGLLLPLACTATRTSE